MKYRNSFILLICFIFSFSSCIQKNAEKLPYAKSNDLKEIKKSDTLRVATMYGSTSYFLFRDEIMGFDYEMVKNLANILHLNLEISIATSESEIVSGIGTEYGSKCNFKCNRISREKRLC